MQHRTPINDGRPFAPRLRRIAAVFCAGGALLLPAAFAVASTSPQVHVTGGEITGETTGDVDIFKGIPFAAPPVGLLRWRAPQPVQSWTGVRTATAFGPTCIQHDEPADSMQRHLFFTGSGEPRSEDCLYLNVWSSANAEKKRPVIVWIYGGGFHGGMSSNPMIDGTALARQGVIVVSFNYRVGRFGFLALPELTGESPQKSSGNYGLLDQIAALQWVKKNIAAFGGDPDNVTVAGQSSGSISISYLMASPLAHGLFERAIGESGASFGPPSHNAAVDAVQDLHSAEQTGIAFEHSLKVSTLAQLRALSADAILNAPPAPSRFDSSWPVIDGYVLPRSPEETFRQGNQNDVPLLTGSNADEGTMFAHVSNAHDFISQAKSRFGANEATYLGVYPASNDAEATASSEASLRDDWFGWQNWTWARLQASTGKAPVYYYYYNQPLPAPQQQIFHENPGYAFKASHGAEIPYIFHTLSIPGGPVTHADTHLSEVVSRYWINFAKSGNPNGHGLPIWPAFQPHAPRAMYLGPAVAAERVHDRAQYAFWDSYFGWQPLTH
jgi:para-nitrobenzyl esterase